MFYKKKIDRIQTQNIIQNIRKKIKKITKKGQNVRKSQTLWIIGGRVFGAFLAKFSKQRVVKNRQKDSVLPGPRKWPKMTFFRDFLTLYLKKNKKIT